MGKILKNRRIKYYSFIAAFLGLAIVFYFRANLTFAEFLIFLLCGVLIGINIRKIKNDRDE